MIGDENVSVRRSSRNAGSTECVVLVCCLVALRVGGFLLIQGLRADAHALVALSRSGETFDTYCWMIDFIMTPVAMAFMNLVADIGAAPGKSVSWLWARIVSSSLQTYFFVRPLLAFAGYDIDPRYGRIGFGLSLVGTAVWISLPGIPGEYHSWPRALPANSVNRTYKGNCSTASVPVHSLCLWATISSLGD